MDTDTEETTGTDAPEAAAPGFAGEAANAELEHTDGGATTRDGMDAGAPMLPGQPDEPTGPEDALGAGPKRGDYSDRLKTGPSLVTEPIPEAERRERAQEIADDSDGTLSVGQAMAEVPATRLVPAGQQVGNVGDVPGKGGVSTAEALGEASGSTAGPDADAEDGEDGEDEETPPAP